MYIHCMDGKRIVREGCSTLQPQGRYFSNFSSFRNLGYNFVQIEELSIAVQLVAGEEFSYEQVQAFALGRVVESHELLFSGSFHFLLC